MIKEKPQEITEENEFDSISKLIISDFNSGTQAKGRVRQPEEEKSLVSMSKYVGVTNFFSSSLKQQALLSMHGKIPSIMFLCIEQIQMRALAEEGIFRIPGTHSKLQETRKLLEAGKKVDFSEIDIMTVASLLKLWLRELPTPLIPFSHYSELIALGETLKKLRKGEKADWMDKVKRIVGTIPSPE